LLWLWPQYFPKHEIVTARLKRYSLDTFERECDLAHAEVPKRPVRHSRIGSGLCRTKAADLSRATPPEEFGGQQTRPSDYWSDPGWDAAVRQYHAAREHRPLVTAIQPERLAQLRRLLRNDISLDRVWRELNERGDQPAPQVTVDALICKLRTDGLAGLEKPNCRRRLADLSDDQLREVLAALIRARTNCAAVTDELLVALDEIRR
jgi:hypothetical protein